jgi:hypothetical protein
MEYKKAMGILLKMLDKYSLDAEEKKAIWTAIGTLDCGSLAENRLKGIIKGRKARQKKNIE